jgi:uncharacterized repeat protein (TIGR03803 family)
VVLNVRDVLALTLFACSISLAQAAAETVIHSFNAPRVGYNPEAKLLIGKGGTLYGTTAHGYGRVSYGSVFKLTPRAKLGGYGWTLLHEFKGQAGGDGELCMAAVAMDSSGALYGTTFEGGGPNNGTIFRLTPPPKGGTAWTETILYDFANALAGTNPEGALIRDPEGNFYGTTSSGNSGTVGGVFELSPPSKGQTAWQYSVLYAFQNTPDGAEPQSALVRDAAGALYGTTTYGGMLCTPPGQNQTSCGMVFKLTPPAKGQTAWTETVLYRFTGQADGYYPVATLLNDTNGVLYGTTTGNDLNEYGTVFSLAPPVQGQMAWSFSLLHTFVCGSGDGCLPLGRLTFDTKGNLDGTTKYGGAYNVFDGGVVFALTPPAQGQSNWTESILWSFGGSGDGALPVAGLAVDSSGNLFGSTYLGGAVNEGALFEITGY